MSLTYQPLEPVLILDPRIDLYNERYYGVLRGGQQTTMKQWTTSSISNSAITFSCPPPNNGIIMSRKVYVTVPIRLTLTGTVPPQQRLINGKQDAPRAFPISQALSSLSVVINNTTVTVNLGEYISALLRYNTGEDVLERDYSTTPHALDMSQEYESLYGSIRNPLAGYGDSQQGTTMGRGGFPFTIVSNPQNETGEPAVMTAVVDMVCREPLFISPLYYGTGEVSGLVNVTSFEATLNFVSKAGFRMWSHMAGGGVETSVTNVQAQFADFTGTAFSYRTNQPLLDITYITPPQDVVIPFNVPITYPYFEVKNNMTDIRQSISAAASTTVTSSNISISSIPNRMYIFARDTNQTLQSSCEIPDTFMAIEHLSVQFMNKNGLLASASQRQLYDMSVKNGLAMSWPEWSGEGVYLPDYSAKYGTVGSVICVEFATDLGLQLEEAPGKLLQTNIQIEATLRNVSTRAISPVLCVVVVNEGTFTIEGISQSATSIGVLSNQDILDPASMITALSYDDVRDVTGGSFLSSLANIAKRAHDFTKKHKLISKGLKLIPHPAASIGSTVADALGYGHGGAVIPREPALLGMSALQAAQREVPAGGAARRKTPKASGGKEIKKQSLLQRISQSGLYP